MSILFSNAVFGPIKSRRLGISLGVNLLPNESKLCNFDCIYCECGWTPEKTKGTFNSKELVISELQNKLHEMTKNNEKLDVITFAGNGEPTMHPYFSEIIDETISARDKYYPTAKISVLTNSTMLKNDRVFNALKKVDNNILKIDSAFEKTINLINKPRGKYSLIDIINRIKQFETDYVIQTMFLKSNYNGKFVDNTTETEVNAWLEIIKDLQPKEVMIYSLDRETPADKLTKIPIEKLQEIANKVTQLGINVIAV